MLHLQNKIKMLLRQRLIPMNFSNFKPMDGLKCKQIGLLLFCTISTEMNDEIPESR